MSFDFNFNTAEKQTGGELIPDGVIVPVVMNIRPGGVGEGGDFPGHAFQRVLGLADEGFEHIA